jgi:hypothetical protein
VFRTRYTHHTVLWEVPTFVAQWRITKPLFDVWDRVEQFYQVDEYELIIPFGHRACCHIIHYFKGNCSPTWRVGRNVPGPKCLVDKRIHQFIWWTDWTHIGTSPTDKYRGCNDAVEVIKFNKYVDLVIAKTLTWLHHVPKPSWFQTCGKDTRSVIPSRSGNELPSVRNAM